MKIKILLLLSWTLTTFLGCDQEDQHIRDMIINDVPKYNNEFIFLDEKYSIELSPANNEYEILNATWMDIDKTGKLYVLDYYMSKIFVFSNTGKYITTIGQKGEGPEDMLNPVCFSIVDNEIYVYERFKGIKVLNLNGSYLRYILPIIHNAYLQSIKIRNDYILSQTILLKKVKPILNQPDYREWKFIKYSFGFNREKYLGKIIKNYNFINDVSPLQINAIDSENNIYLPISDDDYIINKYDSNGKLIISFGRKYQRKTLSDRLTKWMKENMPGNPIPKYLPIVRCTFVDEKDLIWVLLGEWYRDYDNQIRVNSVIDVFNKQGEYLSTFNSDVFSGSTILKNGMLFSSPNKAGDNSIKVYKINYNKE